MLAIGCDDFDREQGDYGSSSNSLYSGNEGDFPDNPGCIDLYKAGLIDYNFYELKIDPPVPGIYDYSPYSSDWFEFTSEDGVYFNWISSIGVDAIISKGGSGGAVYLYDPEETEGFGLHSPVNSSGDPAAISHISVCVDFELEAKKSAKTSYDRTYKWAVEKTANPEQLFLSAGQFYQVSYDVTLGTTPEDSDFAVYGEISVFNPSPFSAAVVSIEDWMGGNLIATDCPSNFDLDPGTNVNCAYYTTVDNALSGVNEVLVEVTEDSMVSGTSATKDYSFGDPTTLIDECVDVNDSLVGVLGQTCAYDEQKSYSYNHEIAATECGTTFTVTNVATATSLDTQTSVWDDAIVQVEVAPCGTGCTLTQGYWKTHSEYGPAPYDETWTLLPDGADTEFFTTGMSYYDVLWTPPIQGNSFFILAHQYIAASLNVLAGAAVTPDVQQALDSAFDLLTEYGDNPFLDGLKGKKGSELRKQFLALSEVLADYNEGSIGPGHCDENDDSDLE